MRTDNIFRKIGVIVAEINEQYQYLSQAPENLNELELELLSANADFLAEHVRVLKKLNITSVTTPPAETESLVERLSQSKEYRESVSPAGPEQVNSDHLIKQEFPESYSSFHRPVDKETHPPVALVKEDVVVYAEAENDNKGEAERIVPLKSDPEPPTEASVFNSFFAPEPAVEEPKSPEKVEGFITQEMPAKNEVPNPPTAVSSVEEEPAKVLTLNEMIYAQQAPVAPPQFNRQPVTDLKSIINLNDKLLFIKDLFNGYSLAYSEAIEIINRFDSFDAADNFLKTNYSTKNNWNAKQATAEKFYELLNRRFSK